MCGEKGGEVEKGGPSSGKGGRQLLLGVGDGGDPGDSGGDRRWLGSQRGDGLGDGREVGRGVGIEQVEELVVKGGKRLVKRWCEGRTELYGSDKERADRAWDCKSVDGSGEGAGTDKRRGDGGGAYRGVKSGCVEWKGETW